MKRKTRRKGRRKAPAVRKIGAGPVMVGGAQSAAESEANMMAAGALAAPSTTTATAPAMVQRQTAAVTPKTAPGTAPSRAPKAAEAAVNAMGTGRALSASERARFEPQFGADLSHVNVHEGAPADRATRALDARAFAYGSDIALSSEARDAGTLAHELAHVTSAGDPYLQRDLIRPPPGAAGAPAPLSDEEAQTATAYNAGKYNATSTEAILDIIGGRGRTSFEVAQVPQIQEWQADFRLKPDGKVGLRTAQPLGQEMIAGGERNPVIKFIVDAHDFDTSNVASITYDRSVAPDNAATTPNWGGKSAIKVSNVGFNQGWRGLVHTIRHEIEHANQVAGMAAPANINTVRPLLEFQAETIEIMSSGMLLEGLGGLFNDASRAFGFWGSMTLAEKRAEWANFQRVRDELQRRFDASSAASQATHQATMNNFANEAAP